MIESLTTNIFRELGFKSETLNFKTEDISTGVQLHTTDNRAFFVVSIDQKNLSFLTDFIHSIQGQFFEWAVGEFKLFTNEMAKNSYLLIAVQDVLKDKIARKVFINIEEDAFFFKKYVLTYSEKELKALTAKVGDSEVTKTMGSLAVDQNIFDTFLASNKESQEFEQLLYQLYLKIPVLSLPTKSKDFENLDDSIEKKIAENDLEEVHRLLTEVVSPKNEKQIDFALFEQVMSKL